MTIENWQYDDLKDRLSELVKDKENPNRETLYECLLHFERWEKWMKRHQEALWYTENECKHLQRKLNKIEKIIKLDVNND
jgi:predicted transcriptional regulator